MKIQRKNHALWGLSVVLAVCFIATSAEAQRGRRVDPAKEKEKEKPVYKGNVQYISMHRMAGCGLGSLAFDKDEKFAQVGASLLNFTGLQSVAVTFGTSNCTYDGLPTAQREREAFIESNLADLSRDLAVGQGEYVSALSALYGCQGESKAVFTNSLQKNSAEMIRKGATAQELMSLADRTVASNPMLSQSCASI